MSREDITTNGPPPVGAASSFVATLALFASCGFVRAAQQHALHASVRELWRARTRPPREQHA